MKIVLFSFANLTHGGGFEKYIMSLSNELSNKRHDVSIITINRRLQYILEFLLSCFYLKPRFRFSDKFRLSQEVIKREINGGCLHEVSSLREMRKYINRADVVYSKNEILDLFVLRILKNKNTPPIICGLHTALFYPLASSIHSKLHNFIYSSRLYGKLLSICSGIHAINSDQITFLKKNCPSLKAKFFYVPHWIELPDKKRKTSRKLKFKILFLGRMVEQKGIDVLSGIIAKLSKKPEFKNIEFKVAGSGVLQYIPAQLSEKYDNVKYCGFVKPRRVPDLYLNSDICIVPSRWETVSYVCLEAQSYGLPTVTSDISGPRDIIINNETGFLIKPADIDSFVDVIIRLYCLKKNNFRKFKSIGERAKKNISDKYSREVIISKLETVFKEIGY